MLPHCGFRPLALLGAAISMLLSPLSTGAAGVRVGHQGSLDEKSSMVLNEQEYFERSGFEVMAYSDYYPEGHQGGVSTVLHGVRLTANGDLRLEGAPGQWSPIPKLEERVVDRKNGVILARLSFPDEKRDRKGFNPIVYPDLRLAYEVRVMPEGEGVGVFVDLKEPLPEAWVGRVGFNLEIFPGEFFGRSFAMDGVFGTFPRQVHGPISIDPDQHFQSAELARGSRLVLAPETKTHRMTIESLGSELVLLDGRAEHNNGWFIVRSLLPAGKTADALHWKVSAETIPAWKDAPVIHVSQVGYHPNQQKIAVIELDRREETFEVPTLWRISAEGEEEKLEAGESTRWGKFLRYNYLQFDFSSVQDAGIYRISYGQSSSNIFRIAPDILERHVWQPTLEYYLPVQMCHMRINDRYRVWHDLCHMDDARMAPINTNHFDGYLQGPSTLTRFESGESVPGLNVGGWHDAGDYDLRVESQIGTVRILSQIYEAFGVQYDSTTVNQQRHLVEMLRPDGVPDVLQQIEHGVLSVLGGYRSLGRLYRGIICPTLRQYTLLGDAASMTDNREFDPELEPGQVQGETSGTPDDRWVFTEENPWRELGVAAGLAAAARALAEYRPELARECVEVAEAIYADHRDNQRLAGPKLEVLSELILTTGEEQYRSDLVALAPEIPAVFERSGWVLGRVMDRIDDPGFHSKVEEAARKLNLKLVEEGQQTPFGMPYKPDVWGAGWGIQQFGVRQYFLHTGWPEIFDQKFIFDALNFMLGSHPGRDTRSFVSGVGAESLTVAYGVNRADWSYIPGGVGSGTALIRPDLPEMKVWPFFWQQSEYVIGGGGTNFMFLALAADQLLKEQTAGN